MVIRNIRSDHGTCSIGENTINYNVGTVGAIPKNVFHKVEAGEYGLYIFAKCTPAL